MCCANEVMSCGVTFAITGCQHLFWMRGATTQKDNWDKSVDVLTVYDLGVFTDVNGQGVKLFQTTSAVIDPEWLKIFRSGVLHIFADYCSTKMTYNVIADRR
jgi:hypothetical protein